MRLFELYLASSFMAITMLVLVAFTLRKSHGMRWAAVVALSVAAGLAWPLLAVAVVQVACFVTLARGFRVIGVNNGRVLNLDEDPLSEGADDETVPMAIVALEDCAPLQLINDFADGRGSRATLDTEPLQPTAI